MSVKELIRCVDIEKDKGKVYCITDDNKRHYIPDPYVAQSYWNDGIDLSRTRDVSYEELCAHPLSFQLATNSDHICESLVKRHHTWSRDSFGSLLRGEVLEFSPASTPWPCNLNSKVEYTDPFGNDEGCKIGYENKDYVPVDYKASMEDMSSIDKQYDFIVSSHVIEHTSKPVLALKNIYDHLKSGGVYVMAVPHMYHTFDQYRQLTPLQHFIDDYYNWSREKDLIHVIDYFEHAHCKYAGHEDDITQFCRRFIDGENFDMHYHTFTEDSMIELLDWVDDNVCHFSSMEVFDRLEGSLEFFVRLTK